MGKLLVAMVVGLLVVSMGLVSVVAVAAGSGSSGPSGQTASGGAGPGASGSSGAGSGGAGSGGAGSGGSDPAVPAGWLGLYQRAAATCPGLPWSVVAAIGTVETGSGRSDAPGVWSGANSAGAEGPMQFEPDTFAAYATVGPGGARPASPYDPVDAVYTAAALLCADGAGASATLRAALLDYNHSALYADTVLTLALALQQNAATSETVVTALSFAAGQLGVPYLWGGTGPGGFDCSGLVQAAYRRAGVTLPRVAQDQYDAGPALAGGAAAEPGDLVFFGGGPTGVEHVGIYVGQGEMIDAPHTGAVVRFDPADQSDLVGATRPA